MLNLTKIRPLEFVIFHTDRLTGTTKLVVDFRRVHKIAKSDYYIHLVCLSVFTQGTTLLPRDEFSRKLIFRYFQKMCPENSSFY